MEESILRFLWMLIEYFSEELSEEDQQLKSDLEMMVERLKVGFLLLGQPEPGMLMRWKGI